MNSLDLKSADETFNKQVFLNSVNLCTKVDAIKDVRVAIEAYLQLTEAKPDFNMEMVANDVTEYNLFNGLLHVLDREKFLVVLGFLIQNTLVSELESFGIESDPFHIKFEGEEKVSAILNNRFNTFIWCSRKYSDNEIFINVQLPPFLQLPDHLLDAIRDGGIHIFCDNVSKYFPDWIKTKNINLKRAYDDELKCFSAAELNDVVRARIILELTKSIASSYLFEKGFSKVFGI